MEESGHNKNKNKYITVHYENTQDNQEIINPSLVVFPMNHPRLEVINDEEKAQWALCQNRDKKRRDDKLLLGESNRIIFDSKTKMNKNQSDYVLGIFSRKKRELKFYDVDSIFPINQKIRRIEDYAHKMEELERQKLVEEINAGKVEERVNNYMDNKLQLIKDFGTAKAKKVASGMKATMVNENNISSVNSMKRLLEDTAVKQNADVQLNEEQQQMNKISTWKEILPEFDLEATEKKAIFALDSIIDSEAMTLLNIQLILDMYSNKQNYDSNKHRFSEFTLSLFNKFKNSKQGLANVPYKIKCAVFLDYMIKFYLLPKMVKFPPEILAKQHDIDIYFVNKFLSNFAESSYHLGDRDKHVKTPLLVLKNIYYILILALLLSDFKFDYTLLANSLKIEEKDIYHYYKEIGCKLSDIGKKGKAKGNMVELEAPLKLNTEHSKYGKNK